TPTITPTETITETPTDTPTETPTRTPSRTFTPQGHGYSPAPSTLPVISNWYRAAVRGLLAMAPPPPLPDPPYGPCLGLTGSGVPLSVQTNVKCGPCPYDFAWLTPIPGYQPKLCAFVDDGFGNPAPRPLPLADRGFDDPQADPDPSLVPSGKSIDIT